MQEIEYYAPQTITELLDTLGETGGRILAGGTDIIPRMRRNMYPCSVLVDASHIQELSFIKEINHEIQIGAMTKHAEMTASELLQQKAPLLIEAVWRIGSPQLRARGTLGGNIANASPAGDTIPALFAYEARLRLVSSKSNRIIRIDDFFTGPGATRLEHGEMIHSIMFSPPKGRHASAFRNMGRRRGLAISVVNTAALLILDDNGVIVDARVALGSVAPTVVRCPNVESALIGKKGEPGICKIAAAEVYKNIKPIGDVRATADYRLQASTVLVERAIEACLENMKKGQ